METRSVPIRIELTEFEQALLEQIDFGSRPGHVKAQASGKASRQLMESLIRRNAIPAARWAYFTDPFPGGRGRSHMETFRKNLEGSNRHIFEDPGFVQRHLRYFLHGPGLPRRTLQRFCELAAEDGIGPVLRFVRMEARKRAAQTRHRIADEFYKLALECFPGDPPAAKSTRDAAMRAR